MVPAHPRRTPLLRSAVLALALLVGTVAVAVGRDGTSDAPLPFPAAAGLVSPAVVGALAALPSWTSSEPGPRYDGQVRPVAPAQDRVRLGAPPPPARILAAGSTTGAGAAEPTATGFHGRDHVWMPALHIDRPVSFYGCSNQSYPGNRVYRWGCAGGNNVYLFGHAGSVFKALHDAYVGGRLRKGTPLYYADGSGHVHTYRVAWWKLTTATKGTWAYASLSQPSLTLQTCIGAQSQYRLIVRLTEVG
jgi:Sortase domain